MNAEIRIYPDKEMYAVDMAELMHASIPESGVLQGCALDFTGGNVTIQPGRLVIKGRLAVVVTEGIIEPSELVTSTVTGHICAICNLADQNEEYVKLQILPQESYDSLVLSSQAYETGDHGDTFNVANGIALLELGTITMTPSGLTGQITLTEAGKKPKNIRTYIEKIRAALNSATTSLKETVTKNRSISDSRYSFLNKRAHSSSKFMRWAVEIPQRTLAAGAKATYECPIRYGTELTWSSNRIVTTYKYPNHSYKEVKDSNGYRTSIKTFKDYGPQFLTPIAVSAIMVRDAVTGGKNSKNCSILAWRFTDEEVRIDVVNNGKDSAVIRVWVQMLYVQEE